MKNKKILLLSPWSGDIDDGRKLRHYYLIKELSRQNIIMDMIAEGSKKKLFKKNIKSTNNFIYYAPNIKTGKYKITKMMARVLNMIFYIIYGVGISIVKRKEYEQVWVSIPHIGPSIIAIFLLPFKKNIVYEIRDPWPKLLVDLNILQKGSLVAKILSLLDNFMLEKSQYIISPNYNIDYIPKKHLKKLIIFPNAVSDDVLKSVPFQKKEKEEEFSLIYAGGAANSYQMDVIIKAVAIVKKDILNIKLNLYLDEREIKRFNPLVEELDIEDNVNFYNKTNQKRLFKNIQKSDFYIFHLKDLEMFRPGISSNKLLDPLICGRPVILGANIENNWVKEANAGIIVQPENPDILASAIKKAWKIRNSKKYDEMCLNAYRYARENLSLNSKIKELKKFGILEGN